MKSAQRKARLFARRPSIHAARRRRRINIDTDFICGTRRLYTPLRWNAILIGRGRTISRLPVYTVRVRRYLLGPVIVVDNEVSAARHGLFVISTPVRSPPIGALPGVRARVARDVFWTKPDNFRVRATHGPEHTRRGSALSHFIDSAARKVTEKLLADKAEGVFVHRGAGR